MEPPVDDDILDLDCAKNDDDVTGFLISRQHSSRFLPPTPHTQHPGYARCWMSPGLPILTVHGQVCLREEDILAGQELSQAAPPGLSIAAGTDERLERPSLQR